MGKGFIEWENATIPYKADTLCFCLTQYARNYIASNREANANIDKNVRDAVLVDVINYMGYLGCYNFGLYTTDLYLKKVDEAEVDPQCLLPVLRNYFATYIFQYDMVKSVLKNNHMNDCTEEFDVNDGATVLVDFINYVAQVNDYDIRFTIEDLYKKSELLKYKNDMGDLKLFLEKVSKYNERLIAGESIDNIFDDVAEKHNLGRISQKGTYYCYDNIKRKMYHSDKLTIEGEIYAMAYAFGTMPNDNKEQPQTAIINKKLLEMKRKKKR